MRIISGALRGRTLKTGEGPGYRPATAKVRSAIFSMLEARGVHWPDTRVLDLFAGSGSLAFETLSRGAPYAMLIEKSKPAANIIRKNAENLGLESGRWKIVCKDLLQVVNSRADNPFDLVFIDPPYGRNLLTPALRDAVLNGWVAPDGYILAEVESRLDIDPEHPLTKKAEYIHGERGYELTLEADRTYGQTRILIWRNENRA